MELSDVRMPEAGLEARLRRHFAENDDCSVSARSDLAAVTLRRRRQQHRQRLAVAGTALGVLLIAGGLPAVRAVLPATSHGAAASSPSASATPAQPSASPQPTDLYDLPARGSLAGDDSWLSSLASRPWDVDPRAGTPDPPPASHRVVYATDLPGERIALVLGRSGGKTAYLWLHGRTGADPGQLDQATTPQLTGTGQPMALLDVQAGTGNEGVLVFVGLPGDSAEYEPPGRAQPIHLHVVDGVAAEQVAGPVDQQGNGRLRVSREGQQPLTVVPDGSGLDATAPPASLPIEDPRGLLDRVDAHQVQMLGRYMTAFYGLAPGRLELVLLATGPVGDRQAVLLGGILPSGQTVAWQGSYGRAHPAAGTGAGTAPGPGAPLLKQTLALRTDGGVVISGPLDGVSARVLDRHGVVVGTVPLQNGAGAGAVSGTPARVRITDASGAVLADAAVGSTR